MQWLQRRFVVAGVACCVLLFLAIVNVRRDVGPASLAVAEAPPVCRPSREAPCPLCTLPPFADAFKVARQRLSTTCVCV